jgi:hypothetical protein
MFSPGEFALWQYVTASLFALLRYSSPHHTDGAQNTAYDARSADE